jgi:hypothetical protein
MTFVAAAIAGSLPFIEVAAEQTATYRTVLVDLTLHSS